MLFKPNKFLDLKSKYIHIYIYIYIYIDRIFPTGRVERSPLPPAESLPIPSITRENLPHQTLYTPNLSVFLQQYLFTFQMSATQLYQSGKFLHCTALILGSRTNQYYIYRKMHRATPFFLPLTLIFNFSQLIISFLIFPYQL